MRTTRGEEQQRPDVDRDTVDARWAGRVLTFGACAVVGAALWGSWFGLSIERTFETAESPVRLVGGAASLVLLTGGLSSRWSPAAAAAGTAFGAWALCSAQLVGGPEVDALWIIASVIIGFLVTVLAAAGGGAGAAVRYALRRRRGGAPASRSPGPVTDLRRTGTALVVVGGGWLLLGAVLRQALPLAWTFAELLRVPLDLAFAVVALAGLVMVVQSLLGRRGRRLGLRPLLSSAACVVLLLAVAVGRALPADDGFTGQVGVMAGPDGSMVAVLGLCEGTVDSVEVLDGGKDAFEPAAALHHDGGLDGVVQVDLSDPPQQWSGTPLPAPTPREGELNVSASGYQSLLNDTYTTRAEVAALEPGTVTYSVWDKPNGGFRGNEQAALADFDQVACSDRGRYPW